MAWHHRLAIQADPPRSVAIYNSASTPWQVTAALEPISGPSRVQRFAEQQPQQRPLWMVKRAGRVVGWLSCA